MTQADADAWLDGFMPYALARDDVAGAVVVIVKDGRVLTQRGFGYADVAQRKAVDPANTLFRAGSVSKLFTWTAVMQLVEKGKLDLDVDINRYLDFSILQYEGKPITLRNLMTHTPDLKNWREVEFGSPVLCRRLARRSSNGHLGVFLRRAAHRRIQTMGRVWPAT